MAVEFSYSPPAVSAMPLVSAAADVAVKYGADILLSVSRGRCPKESGRLRDSGEVTDFAGVDAGVAGVHVAAVSYGREDGENGEADTADYAVYQHESLQLEHPVGEAKWLETSMHSESADVLAAMAEPIRAVL